ncbi:MAG: UPF0175 family protein [Candidatus Nanohalobium sp.]
MSEVDIPRDVFDSVRIPESGRKDELRMELAVSLYDRGALSFGKARQLVGVSKARFQEVLGKRGVERHYAGEELEEDVEYAKV